jgi:hypothetical protein
MVLREIQKINLKEKNVYKIKKYIDRIDNKVIRLSQTYLVYY